MTVFRTALLAVTALAASGCVRWAIDSDLEEWDCTATECSARLWLENPYDAKVVVTTYVVAYREVGVRRDNSAPYVIGGFEQGAGSEDIEVGRTESRHVLGPNEARQVFETVTVSLAPSKLALIVSEARSVVE